MNPISNKCKSIVLFSIIICLLTFNIETMSQEKKDNKQTGKATEKKKPASTRKRLENLLTKITADVEKQAKGNKKNTENSYELEIDGLIIDQTKTKIGREFYDLFFTRWEAPEGIKGYTIDINEKAHPRFGSLIWISINETIVYQSVLKPRYETIEEASKIGITATKQFLFRSKDNQRQLSGEDMSGTGIY